MNRIDDQIRAALSDEDRRLLDQFGDEPGLFELVAASFRSKMRFFVIATYALVFVLLGVTIWFLIEMLNAQDALSAVKWGVGIAWTTLGISMLKMWNWMQMNHQATLRELKRIELQIAMRDGRAASPTTER